MHDVGVHTCEMAVGVEVTDHDIEVNACSAFLPLSPRKLRHTAWNHQSDVDNMCLCSRPV